MIGTFAKGQGYSRQYVQELNRIADLMPDLLDLYDEKRIPHWMAYQLAQLPARALSRSVRARGPSLVRDAPHQAGQSRHF
jgi:hypothetical protein